MVQILVLTSEGWGDLPSSGRMYELASITWAHFVCHGRNRYRAMLSWLYTLVKMIHFLSGFCQKRVHWKIIPTQLHSHCQHQQLNKKVLHHWFSELIRVCFSVKVIILFLSVAQFQFWRGAPSRVCKYSRVSLSGEDPGTSYWLCDLSREQSVSREAFVSDLGDSESNPTGCRVTRRRKIISLIAKFARALTALHSSRNSRSYIHLN